MELFDESTMNLDLQGETKDQIIEEMVTLLDEGGVLADKEAYKKAIYAREEQSSTGLGFDIAIPHAKTAAVKTARVPSESLTKDLISEPKTGQKHT